MSLSSLPLIDTMKSFSPKEPFHRFPQFKALSCVLLDDVVEQGIADSLWSRSDEPSAEVPKEPASWFDEDHVARAVVDIEGISINIDVPVRAEPHQLTNSVVKVCVSLTDTAKSQFTSGDFKFPYGTRYADLDKVWDSLAFSKYAHQVVRPWTTR